MSKKFWKGFGIACVFLSGALAGAAFGPIPFDDNVPVGFTIMETGGEVIDTLNPLNFGVSPERASPSDFISNGQVEVYSDRVILDIKNAEWAIFTNTNSMDPVIDETAAAIEVEVHTEADVEVGDIVSYKSDFADGTIIHRIIYKGYDEEGVYYIMKGDNNPTSDPGKVRIHQMLRKVVAIIY